MIDISHEINAVRRQVGTRVLAAGEARTVTISRVYHAAREDVWDACTSPERIRRWFLPVSGDLRQGGRYQLEGNASGVIESCDPPNGFSATWEFGGQVSWIEVSLVPEPAGGTRLRLTHISPVDERWAEFGPGAVGIGWDLAVLGLGLHLSTGQGFDPEAGAAWAGSPDGQRFMALSNDRWRAASIEAGTRAGDAQAAADRTLAAYTGPAPETPAG